MKENIAQIAIVKPLHNLFDYEIPKEFQILKIGARVKVEFGKKEVIGFVINIKAIEKKSDYKLKKIIEVIDQTPLLDIETIDLFKWISNYYHSPIGQVISTGTPNLFRQGKKNLCSTITKNQNHNNIQDYVLTNEQQLAIKIIKKSLYRYKSFLLDGITGSGKTEVYKKIQDEISKNNLQTLIIVPEKNLIPELLKYFNYNKLRVIEYHSSLTPKQKFENWNLAQNCEADVIIGTRSSVFLKIPKLGLIIIDEEHDISHKNNSETKYNARDVAVYRASKKNIPIILGSATPSSETILNVLKKKYTQIKMRKRINDKKLPSLKLINMSNKKNIILSDDIISEINLKIKRGEQTLIFLNRRGYSPILNCRDCKWIPKCKNCNLNMTYHKKNNFLMCHHCSKKIKFKNICHNCESKDIAYIGEGTEKIEEVINQEFKNANIVRIDSDNTRKKGQAEKIFKEIKDNKFDIIIGTQMLSKGHNFPNITLVVIMNIDQSLFSPRLKAIEQLAQQLVQVSGRSGRGELPGKVILQTGYPENEDLKCLINEGYENWINNLLNLRKNLGLPPFRNWGIFQAKARKYQDAENFLENIKKIIEQRNKVEIFGPMPSIMQKKANFFNFNLVIQTKNKAMLNYAIKDCIPLIKDIPYQNRVRWSVDIDPVDYD